jgi:hypothetical protein
VEILTQEPANEAADPGLALFPELDAEEKE